MLRMAILTGQFCILALTALVLAGCNCNCSTPADKPTSAEREEQTSNPDAPPQATFGNGALRNMVNTADKNVPTMWSIEEGKMKNIKWVAKIGTYCYTNPVVSDGRIFIGTNTAKPDDDKTPGQKAHLMCFAEKDGALLWENIHKMPEEEVIRGFAYVGQCATPTVEREFIYYCTPGAEVICAHAKDGKAIWRYDMIKELKVFPCFVCACSPLIVGDQLFVVTGNGCDAEDKVVSPKAPSFIALDKKTGKLQWQNNMPGDNIIQGQWSNPVYSEVNGKPQIIFPGGDGYLYGLEPKTGDLIWKFQCSPSKSKARTAASGNTSWPRRWFTTTAFMLPSAITPNEAHPPKSAIFTASTSPKKATCPAKTRISIPRTRPTRIQPSFGTLAAWSSHARKTLRLRRVHFGYSTSTAAVHDGLVFIGECSGYLHCLDARTGQHYWAYDLKDGVLGSPYWADGKIYLLTHGSECHIFEASKKLQPVHIDKEAPADQGLRSAGIDMNEAMASTPVVANGVLYIVTSSKLYAISAK